MSGYDFGGWRPYVPVAQRRAQAWREMEKRRKRGKDIQPVEIQGRTIARSFWGKGWCEHLESFGDYSNRLPRGRTYVRNGSVCHLSLKKGVVEAVISGSELYEVKVRIDPLKKPKWSELKRMCTGKIGSLIELLQGKLSEEILAIVVDRQEGLFPLPGEIRFQCNCPDWAGMCKHIAAVMYGVGARLDDRPELLFALRGVDHEELISAEASLDAMVGGGSKRSRRRSLAGQDLEGVFGVDLDESAADANTSRRLPGGKRGRSRKKAVKRKMARRSVPIATASAKAIPTARKQAGRKTAAGKRNAPRRKRRANVGQRPSSRAPVPSPPSVADWV